MSTEPTTAPPRRKSSRTKGIVAIAAGAVLLLGGGTTLAYWSTTLTLDAGTVNSGDLDLALGDATWTLDGVIGDPVAVADPSVVNIVPGDVLTLTQEIDVTLVGDTIEALLSADTADLVPADAAAAFTVELDLGDIGTPDGDAVRLTPDDVADPITATLTITFDPATADRDFVNTPLDLSEVGFTLEQASS